MTVVLYIEGGGDNRRLGAQFREGWASFFAATGLRGRMPKVIRGGSRAQTCDRFCKEVAERNPETVHLLLVDSECPDIGHGSVWSHLEAHDGWRKPANAAVDDAFLMVQVMETWFLADREALRRYFGARFRERAYGDWRELERVPKATVLRASAGGRPAILHGRTPRDKVSTSTVLGRADPTLGGAACTHAEALIRRAEGRVGLARTVGMSRATMESHGCRAGSTADRSDDTNCRQLYPSADIRDHPRTASYLDAVDLREAGIGSFLRPRGLA